MIRPRIETEDLLLTINKNCETPIKQTYRKSEEMLEFRMIESIQTFHFTPSIPIERSWMLGLTSLEVYNSIFSINTTKNKFEFYTDIFFTNFHLES